MNDSRPDPNALLSQLSREEEQKNKGKLKIFFGYSAGVGKTYAMLQEAHELLKAGVDVVIGYIELHQRPATLALIKGLPQIPPLTIPYKSIKLHELDIDEALKRKPAVILVDELAHTNAKGSRNAKRYKDVEELLHAGIDVYTTINVQHIESLHDIVQSITGVTVRERIPDSVFDSADKVELVDIEPEDLMARLAEGKVYKDTQAKRALQNFFTKENLVALREISLRRTADRVNIDVERNRSVAKKGDYFTNEHILVCLSSSPSNAKVVRTAAKLAEAFHAEFTALYVETAAYAGMSSENKSRLHASMRLAEQFDAKIAAVYGDDIPYQIAEYAKVSGVSRIVLGRPVRRFGSPNLVDKLTAHAPGFDVYVIPNEMKELYRHKSGMRFPVFSLPDTLRTFLCLALATLIGLLFSHIGFTEANIITVYILASLITATVTRGRIYSIASSFLSVMLFNLFFTEPYYTLNINDPRYLATFVIMFIAALITSTLTKSVKEHAQKSSHRAYRTEVLLETSQKIGQAKSKENVLIETLRQIKKLMNRECFAYPVKDGRLSSPITIDKHDLRKYSASHEYAVAEWVFINNKHAGATTDTLSGATCLYLSIRSNHNVFAVVGIDMDGEKNLDYFEKGLLISILDESAMVLEKEDALAKQHEMTLRAENERLRANLLRAVSHDLRTPLTSIAGGSNFLLGSLDSIDKDTLLSVLTDIKNDAQWLSSLVENLLNMTRIQDGNFTVTKKPELVDEIINAALSKVITRSGNKTVHVEKSDVPIFVPMDAQLMMQVLINLLDNAFKHTIANSRVEISYHVNGRRFFLSVSDNGGGFPSDRIDKVFDMFFTVSQNGDGKQRGMGLGLSICKSIVEAHDGVIRASNNKKGGATIMLTLPIKG